MKQIQLIAVLFTMILFASCKGKDSGADNTVNTNSVETSGSGNDVYIEMTNYTSGKNMQMQGNTKMYLAASGKVRAEMVMTVNDKPSGAIISIADASSPYQSTVLDDSAKTYYINQIDTAKLSDADGRTTYAVNKIGEEKIAGFNCIHAQIIATKNYGSAASFMNGVDTTDLWLSKDVPVPSSTKKYMEFATGKMSGLLFNGAVTGQLRQMGCEGFMVKFAMHSKNVSSVSQIGKVSHDNFPESLFEVPAGYKQTERI